MIPSRSNLESQWISWSYLQERGWQLHPWVVPPYHGWWPIKDASVSPIPKVSFPPYILQQCPSPMQPKTMCTWWPKQSTFRMEEGFGASLSLLWRHVYSSTVVTVTLLSLYPLLVAMTSGSLIASVTGQEQRALLQQPLTHTNHFQEGYRYKCERWNV